MKIAYPNFDELISICKEDAEEIYLAYNAQTALPNFFTTHPPSRFEMNHVGKNRKATKVYFIGDYE